MSAVIKRPDAESIERVVIGGDLGKMNAEERMSYYKLTCESLGLNPLTKPFEYITLNGKLTLYARKDCTDQLRNSRQVSVTIPTREVTEGVYVVTARAALPNGRTDESIGAVPIEGLKGESRSNAMMKAETKAKRRVTLSICGLGMLDETEIDSIPSARPPSDVARTTVAIDIGGPKGASNQKGETSPKVAAVRESAERDTPAPPDNIPAIADALQRNKGETPPEREPGSDDGDECIDLPRQRALHRAFKDALPAFTSKPDAILQEWLKTQGYVGPDGNGTTKTIPMALFAEVKLAAESYARGYRA